MELLCECCVDYCLHDWVPKTLKCLASRDSCEQTMLASVVPACTPQLRCPTPEALLRRSSTLVKLPDRLDLKAEQKNRNFLCSYDY